MMAKNNNIDNWVYLHNKDNSARYILGEKATKMIACIGINPSTAAPHQLDNTLKSVKRIANFNGYSGWVMYNIYPQRATNPQEIHPQLHNKIHKENLQYLKQSIIELKINTVWVACGNLIESRDYLPGCMLSIFNALKELNLSWQVSGTLTKKGHPRHPLYQSKKTRLIAFDMETYVNKKLKLH